MGERRLSGLRRVIYWLVFPGLAKWAEEQGFPPDTPPAFAERTLLSPQLLAYALKPAKEQHAASLSTDGVAYQLHSDGAVFQLAEVRLPASAKRLATAMLNAYAAPLKQ